MASRTVTNKGASRCSWSGCTRTPTYDAFMWQIVAGGCDVHIGSIVREWASSGLSVQVVRRVQSA
jgi:hypothetical protein